MDFSKTFIIITIALLYTVCIYGQTNQSHKETRMYATLINNSQGYPDCDSTEKGSTFILEVITASDTLIKPKDTLAIALICTHYQKEELSIGKSYDLLLSNETTFNNLEINDLLIDDGKLINQHNKDEIYWVLSSHELNPNFIRRAKIKLGIADFPMKKLNVKIPLSSIYRAFSDNKEKSEVMYPLINTSNYSFPINEKKYNKNREIGIFVDTTVHDYYNNKYEGYRMYLYNNSNDTASFPSIDNRILLIAQAQDSNGIWQDFEEVMPSNCGNSYYNVQLNPGNQWSFTAPLPSGKHSTKIRMSLRYLIDGTKGMIFSNVYEGSVNWSQLSTNE